MDLLKYVCLSQVKMEHDQIEAETAVRVQRFVQSITLYFFISLSVAAVSFRIIKTFVQLR